MEVSRDIIEKMASASHYKQEVAMNMTALAELLETFSDTVFTVQFHKQPTVESAQEALESVKYADLTDKKTASQLVKEITDGALCTMTCHLITVENHFGRSTVIDLGAQTENKFRQVDHRTIEYIIFKNVKYVLKKGSKKDQDMLEEQKKGEPLWDTTQLAVGNWFSTTEYFTVKQIAGDQIVARSGGKDIQISRDIIEHEMYNADVFDKTEKLSLTKVVKNLRDAHSSAFTINFNLKVDEKAVQERL